MPVGSAGRLNCYSKRSQGIFALAFVKNHQTKQVKLIDGDMMVELLIRYELGLDCIGNYKLYQIDNEYFEEKS